MEKDWKEKRYKKVYNDTIEHLDALREHDPTFNIEKLEKMLETEYMNDGAHGNNEVAETIASATIAAYQAYLVDWKLEEGRPASIK